MFSGIVEALGHVEFVVIEGSNKRFRIECPFSNELKIDQSIAHDGVCLTVVAANALSYEVVAIAETLQRTNLEFWKQGTAVNLERCLRIGDRLDGHMVQGHVDNTAVCKRVEALDGSWKYWFDSPQSYRQFVVSKGSVCVNGVSLTVVDVDSNGFSVCIIPYTYEHTNFKNLKAGDVLNLEFDIIGKYVLQYLHLNN